jgi:hypothetical protein
MKDSKTIATMDVPQQQPDQDHEDRSNRLATNPWIQ